MYQRTSYDFLKIIERLHRDRVLALRRRHEDEISTYPGIIMYET